MHAARGMPAFVQERVLVSLQGGKSFLMWWSRGAQETVIGL